ncbi:ArsR/SmtB family transcription factor [Blastococcus goldschmidtiae]|uniref:Metalloregulator ArsR/SmtB family transcription factor n=1 Tax=Blastococcus goldschmidtiae TaxID=3075546 RepID=A0ABU2KB51_9ACTN|nr:metalloregulator ArsR/SmtB family transcription factor [Blastococcus sp. DSM 46792]MDT0277419.1 metalloregulator ArsR/SmtB family transcription factor [Blastococcus sp. DSM 46792]
MSAVATDIGQVFAALGDPQRRHLLEALAGHPAGASATTLAGPLPVSRQAVDKHLRLLERAGLVSAARHGREMRFTVRRDQLDRSADWLTELGNRWEQRLAGLKTAAEALDDDWTAGPAHPEPDAGAGSTTSTTRGGAP